MKMTPSRGPPSLSWDGEGRSVRCDVNGVKCTGTTHPRATYGAHTNVLFCSADSRQKRQWDCPPLMGEEDGSPIHSTASRYSAQKSHRTADAPPDITNCPTQSLRRAMELIC
ncbi:hypothetical protein TcCL_Unassigned05605 [Trypanosoma cruzi]|nr:hypothetical protein TcCL_Unassigned05605 [Trypanosoma cruzi]